MWKDFSSWRDNTDQSETGFCLHFPTFEVCIGATHLQIILASKSKRFTIVEAVKCIWPAHIRAAAALFAKSWWSCMEISVICQMKAARGSLGKVCLCCTRDVLSPLPYSYCTFGFKMPPLRVTLDRPKVWRKSESPKAGPVPLTQDVRHLQSHSLAQQETPELRTWGQRGCEVDQEVQLPKGSKIRTEAPSHV